MSELLASELKKLFFTLNRIAGAADKVKKGLVVLRNFIGTIHLNVGDIGLDIEPFAGIADSGNIEADLADLFECVAEAAKEKKKAVLLLVCVLRIPYHRSAFALLPDYSANHEYTARLQQGLARITEGIVLCNQCLASLSRTFPNT